MVSRAEWRWAAVASLLVMALTTLPYAVGGLRAGPAWHFSGFVFAVDDGNSYIAKMALGARGAWLFHLFYTTEPHQGILAFTFHFLLGKLAVLVAPPADSIALHDRLVWWYHGARVACGIAALLVSYRFIAEFLRLRRQRRLAFVLVALGGGLGWLWTLAGGASLPLDFYSPEAFTFLSLYGLPHLALARALFLGGLLLFWRGAQGGGLRSGVWAGVVWLALGFVQPLYLVVAYVVVAAAVTALALFQRARLRPAILAALPAGLLSLPLVLYNLFAFGSDPILAQWQRQNLILSPNPLHYVVAWGLWLLPGALAMARWAEKRGRARPGFTLLIAWLAVVPVLIYLPYNLQRRFAEGAQLPLVILAVWGLTVGLAPLLRRPLRRAATILVAAFSLLTTPLLLAGGIAGAASPAQPIFVPADELAMFRWLGENAAPDEAVLTYFVVSNALPAYAPLKVYVGHGPETAFADRKVVEVEAFFNIEIDDEFRLSLLRRGQIAYVMDAPAELTERAVLSRLPYLRLEAQAGEYAVYRVVLDEAP